MPDQPIKKVDIIETEFIRHVLINVLRYRTIATELNGAYVLESPRGDTHIILKPDVAGSGKPPEREYVVLMTGDCLGDYYLLKQNNIIIHSMPYCRPNGLALEFTDPSGNFYSLLEERYYES